MISVLIFTRNEELDLPGCLESVSWSDDVHVLDSFSTDRTVEIATRFGAEVHQRQFDNYASQKNAGLHGTMFRHEWVLLLDADERIPAPLAREMRDFVANVSEGISAARFRRRDFFMGTWLKRAQISPFYIRLVRPRKVWYEREVNEVLKVEGRTTELKQPFDHYPFSKGIRHWLDRHNVYSTMEARIALASKVCGTHYSIKQALFARDFNQRRYHQKGLFFGLPFRPLIKFAYMMFWRGAILDGRAGLTYALLQSFYEYMIVLKTKELEKEATGHQPEPFVRARPRGTVTRDAASVPTPPC
jgi:glycosyltransferase involved in cell wall biosynthesis